MKVLLDGQLRSSEQAVISVFDHGFLYGMGLFETFRTYGGRPWLLERHARRLAEGCRLLGFRYEPDPARMAADVARLAEANGLTDAYVRWSVSAGDGVLGLPAGDYGSPREIVYVKPLGPDEPGTRSCKTLRLLRLRRSGPEGEFRLKSFHYMNNILGKRELAASGAGPSVEGLFLDESGYVSEGLVSNVLWIADETLHSPSAEAGPLAGVTAAFVRELAASRGLRTREGLYAWNDLPSAEEIFVTNSIQEIVPVTALENAGGEVLNTWPQVGKWTKLLMEEYRSKAQQGGWS
ncbi:aminotransferase class IV [Cohnella zeiphila]|uniref:Aminotransferase class IV n=1 Tax=Cohnella zeiphila TaxID=2761120 RepID=A0A7X0VX91_9BACL|nr:aminotransferase class IV [Cohnella zeiphila]MBB6733345.1 aminotransferase class IV [Cohnella zeiphila]